MKVRFRMTRNQVILAPGDNSRKAWQLMDDHGSRRSQVLDNEAFVGIVIDRDTRHIDMSSAILNEHRYVEYILDRVQVDGIMTPYPLL